MFIVSLQSNPTNGKIYAMKINLNDTFYDEHPFVLRPEVIAPLKCSGQPIASDYDGVPLSDVVAAMTPQGINLHAQSSACEPLYLKLATGIRYLTDFDEERMFANLPAFYLSEEQRVKLIRQAIRSPRAGQIPQWVQEAVEKARLEHCGEENSAHVLSICQQEVLKMPILPEPLQLICNKVPTGFRPAMVISLLPILGTLATQVRCKYADKNWHSFSFFSCVTAPQASGKSFIRKPIDILLRKLNEQDEAARETERDYKRSAKALEKVGEVLEDPEIGPRNVGVNTTIPRMLQLLKYAKGKHLVGICEEIDSLQRNERGGARGQKQDIFRLAFDNAHYSQENMGGNSFSANVPVYYNVLVTGTLGATYRYFTNTESGLVSRVAFARLTEDIGGSMPDFGEYSEEEQVYLKLISEWLMERQDKLESRLINDKISQWVSLKGTIASAGDSRSLDIFRKRSAVIGFRAGCLCWLLGQADLEVPFKEEDAAEVAVWVAEYVLRTQMELFGNQIESEEQRAQSKIQGKGVQNLLHLLPHDFKKEDLIALRLRFHQSSNVAMVLSRWEKSGWIAKTGRGTYRKIA